MKKKTPKVSKRRAKQKERKEKIIIAGIFIAFIALLAFLFYFTEFKGLSEDTVAVVNGKKITKSELDWWYHTSVLPQYRSVITKENFLVISLIPQEVLLQKAEDKRIKVTDDEVEKSLGIYVIENGQTLDEFEAHLESRGITLDQIKESFKIKAIILKLLENENIYVDTSDAEAFFGRDVYAVQEYIDELMEDADIQIFPENIEPLTLIRFEETRDELCGGEKPVVRLYTTTKCKVCENSSKVFDDVVGSYIDKGIIDAKHWSLDTGDNLLTDEKENGVPKEEIDLFKKYGKGKVPATVVGCKYRLIGILDNAQDEFNEIMGNILGE